MPVSSSEAAFVRALVYERAAIVLEESKAYLIDSRLEPLAREGGYPSVDALVQAARTGSEAFRLKLVDALTTNETSFFRDLAPFDCLRRALLPALVERRSSSRKLTFWSAACSSGQEPYSLAMLIADHFPDLAGWSIRILASDFSETMLDRARLGLFRQLEVNRGLPATSLVKHFTRSGIDWKIKPELRQRVEFSRLNLRDPWCLVSRPDVVFLRNVLIYFDSETKRSVLNRVRESLAPDGLLFLGAAETTLSLDPKWERLTLGSATLYRPLR